MSVTTLKKQFTVARDNNPSLVRAVLASRGYEETPEIPEDDEVAPDVSLHWAQSAMSVDWQGAS